VADTETAGDGQDVRARILRASVSLIDERGLAALSMREVARRAGLSHQAPYNHFEDRESILAALCEEGFDELRRRTNAAKVPASNAAGDLLERSGNAYVSFAFSHPTHFRIMFRPELVAIEKFPRAHACAEAAFAELVEVVGRYVAGGRGWNGKERVLVSMCWSIAHGLASLLLDGPLRPEAAETVAIEQHVKDVMHAFRMMLEAARTLGSFA
jgi:AcrR family transcriptional regulator